MIYNNLKYNRSAIHFTGDLNELQSFLDTINEELRNKDLLKHDSYKAIQTATHVKIENINESVSVSTVVKLKLNQVLVYSDKIFNRFQVQSLSEAKKWINM